MRQANQHKTKYPREAMMAKKDMQKPIEHYTHTDKERVNNPPVGLVTPKSDPEKGEKKTYQYDPHLDPQLQWAGKAEHTYFVVPTVSLHVHERIDAKTIIESVTKTKDDSGQMSLFDEPKPLREALAFYQHKENWSNRLIAGDSLLVMNSLMEKEGKPHHALAPRVKRKYLFGQRRTLQYSIRHSQYMLHSEGKTWPPPRPPR